MPEARPVPLDRLPHGREAVLLTRAAIDDAAGVVHGRRDAADPDLAANPSGFVPACFLIEMMAQTAGLGLPGDGGRGAVVAAIRRLRFHRAARARETVEIDARLERRLGPLFSFECRATASGDLLADGAILLRVV